MEMALVLPPRARQPVPGGRQDNWATRRTKRNLSPKDNSPAQMSPSPTEERAKQSRDLAVGPGRTREAVIFLHLPKTAGTTLNRLIEWEYPFRRCTPSIRCSSTGRPKHLRNLPKHAWQRPACSRGTCSSACMKYCRSDRLTSRCCVTRLKGCSRRTTTCGPISCIHSTGNCGGKNGRSSNSCDALRETTCNVRSSPAQTIMVPAPKEFGNGKHHLNRHFSVVGISEVSKRASL